MKNLALYVPNLVRVGTFGLCLGSAVLAVAVKASADNTRESMMSLGRQMLRYTDGHALANVRTVSLNGARMQFSTGATDDGVSRVLDHYEAQCRARDGQIGAQVREGVQGAPASAERDALLRASEMPLSMIRLGGNEEGFVACFDLGQTRMTMQQLMARVQRVADTGDLQALGNFRYVYATKPSTSANARTHLVGFWTDGGSLNVQRMFPQSGDAPGRDVPTLPRPPSMRRVMNAFEVGHAQSFTVYSGIADRTRTEAFLRTQLVSRGWQLVPMRDAPATALSGNTALTFERGRENVTYILGTSNQETTVTVLSEEARPLGG